jgi:hypothetical protein
MLVTDERCSWCGTGLEQGDGWRAAQPSGERLAVFCRLEHLVPWAIQGPRWDAGRLSEPPGIADALADCAHCGRPLADDYVLIVRHRGEHRIPDGFCSAGHMAEWAKRGGRWAPGAAG